MKKGVQIRFGNKEPLVVGDKAFSSSNDWNLTENELEKARTELGETDENKRRYLKEIKDKLSKEGNYRLEDEFLLRFLRVRKYDCEKAYQNVKNYYNNRKRHADLFGTPSNFSSLKSQYFAGCLPYVDEEGRILFWAEIDCWNSQEESFSEVMQLVNGMDELIAMNPKCQVNGVIGIWDLKGITARQIAEALRRNQLFSMISVLMFSIPWRIKKVLLLNTVRPIRFVYSLVRPLLSKKLAERVFFLGSDMSELHQHVNPAILPKKLGGLLEDDICKDPNFVLANIPYLQYERSFTGD